MFFLKNFLIDITEQFLNRIAEYLIDKISKSPIGWDFMIHQIHEPQIHFAAVFQLTKRDISICHKSEQDCFQHTDRVIPKSSHLMFRDFLQVFLQIDFSHKSIKCQHRITNVQIILNQYWQNCLFGVRISVCYFFHCRLILTQKEDLGFIMNPWSFFFIGYVFSQPLARSLATIYIFARARIFGTLVPF